MLAMIFWFVMVGFAMLISGVTLVSADDKGWIGPTFIAIGATLVAMALVLLAVSFAEAHDNRRPDLIPWFNKLQSGKGPCCDGKEAMHLTLDKWKTRDGHYVVEVPRTAMDFDRAREGQYFESMWVVVPDDAVITEPNLDGATMVWPMYAPAVSIRCFIAGTLT